MTSELDTTFRILTPLLAFERVFRRTGAIRKTCIVHNLSGEPLRLGVRCAFAEHSWFQIRPEREGAEVDRGDGRLLVPPGETRLRISMDTDSSNFPYDGFRGRVYFEEPEAARANGDARTVASQWVEISFEQIDDLRDFLGYAAIDLGTSNSLMSLYHLEQDAVDGAPWTPDLEDDGVELPSAVFVRDLAQFRKRTDGSCSVGRTAIREYASDPLHDPRSLQMGVKRLVGVDRVLTTDAHGAGGYVDPLELLTVLGRAVRERSQSHRDVRACIRRLIVTFPPTWDYRQIDRWKDVFRRLGYGDEDLDLSLDEASAAGLFHVHRWTRDADSRNRLLQDLLHTAEEAHENGVHVGDRYTLELLSFDFGGGTIDLARIRVALTLLDEMVRMRIELAGSDSMPYGGDQVTLAVFRILKRRIAMGLSDPRRARGVPDDEEQSERHSDPRTGRFVLPSRLAPRGRAGGPDGVRRARELIRERWDDLESEIASCEIPRELDDAVDAVFPTRFLRSPDEPVSPGAKGHFAWLWERAERLKCDLFREASRRDRGLALSERKLDDVRGGVRLADLPDDVSAPESDAGDTTAWVGVEEVYRAIGPALEQALERARRLAGDQRIDRVVLTGQSSWIPLVRRLFTRPRSEGGFGLAPSKIEFDESNAKAAVSKGACLLRVMRDAMVGFDVDVSDFKANLLADIFYKSPVNGPRVLFRAGPVDDLKCVEESPDPASFARRLSVFHSSAEHLLGQFDFGEDGAELPAHEAFARATASVLKLDAFPSHPELLALRDSDPPRYGEIASALRDWPERVLIAWMETSASPGTARRPRYRYYLSRNRNLLAVRDSGENKRLFALHVDDRARGRVPPAVDPFSGVH